MLMNDLFSVKTAKQDKGTYTAEDIEVLEGLEPVRRRPGMYIGGTDENALHHLVSEVLDNAMDEAVAGYATRITIAMQADGSITIEDNGRGIPVDPHPKFPDKSALEVILTTLHSGGKFSNKAYQTAGGLHGVGVSVVNALSERFVVEVVRDKNLYRQKYSQGAPITTLEIVGPISNKRGTSITFHHDPEIFGEGVALKPLRIYELAKSKAYLHRGIEIKWTCDESIVTSNVPANDILHFPDGLSGYLLSKLSPDDPITTSIFSGEIKIASEGAKVEWAIGWHEGEGFTQSYCNTIPTPLGGTHEQGLRAALLRGLKVYGEMIGNKRASNIIIDDILESACVVLSIFIREPLFQGQTKEKLVSSGASKLVENTLKDRLDHWLSGDKANANKLLDYVVERMEERLSRKSTKAVNRKSFTQKLRLPGKLTDCTRDTREGTELFIVEGDSAGGSAKQARNRETQAILPLRGKILNVANSSADKISQNQEITDLGIALACGSLGNYREENLRYDKIIIMTDADVDGAHIAALLMTFFYMRMPGLIAGGHLYMAHPPLYRLTQNNKTYYASSDAQKEKLMLELSKNSRAKIELGRFKGLGEMTAAQLKDTTMNPKNRLLTKVTIDSFDNVSKIVDDLMGRKPEKRFQFIYEQALTKMESMIGTLDV
jgi:topoisomerase-4 subunit B